MLQATAFLFLFANIIFTLTSFKASLLILHFTWHIILEHLALFAYGAFGGKDLVAKWGYKKSIVYGLLFSALGAVAMIIAVNANTFAGMLVGFFIVALGFSLQQTAAQPFALRLVIRLQVTGRVNLGGGVNSFGTMIGPFVVAFALFGTTATITDEQIAGLGLSKVIVLVYLCWHSFYRCCRIILFFEKSPAGISTEKTEKANKALYSLLIMTGLLLLCLFRFSTVIKLDPLPMLADADKTCIWKPIE